MPSPCIESIRSKKIDRTDPSQLSWATIMVLFSFLFFLIGITGIIGFWAARQSKKTEADYFLAGQNVSPHILAFSSMASKFSGFVFAGFMGMAYANGTQAIWLGLGLLFGALLVYMFTVFRLQKLNTGGWALSIAELLTFWNGEDRIWLRRFIGLLTLFFLSFYAAAQLKAGGKALEVALGQPGYAGILISSIIILFYCWTGGIRASIWTDSMQIMAMTASLLIIFLTAVSMEGGFANFFQAFLATAPGTDEVALIPQNLSVIGGYSGWALFFIGSIGFGVCTIGQPHILIRAMAIEKPQDTKKFLITHYIFETLFVTLFMLVGLSTRVILKNADSFDAELALFLAAMETLPPILVGFVLAGAFSSTLSTADSQILSCSASLMRDLPKNPKESLVLAKAGTVAVTAFATLVALFAKDNVLALVIFAFGGLGTSIGSILLLRVFNSRISEWGAILVGLAGGTTFVLWDILGLKAFINGSVPGFAVAFAVYLAVMGVSSCCSKRD
ncbi:MAG: sodium/proline symporter [Bacteriovoracales bacterium]|nr:sodium/proline symporter [Bacteriovoracales bacterium]